MADVLPAIVAVSGLYLVVAKLFPEEKFFIIALSGLVASLVVLTKTGLVKKGSSSDGSQS